MAPSAPDDPQLRGQPYQLRCTLTFGDIYAQILIWMAVIFVSLAAGLALMGASRPLFALVGVGLILVLSLPFLLFAFTTTRLNHIALEPRAASSPSPGSA
jgi:hypothetical protein